MHAPWPGRGRRHLALLDRRADGWTCDVIGRQTPRTHGDGALVWVLQNSGLQIQITEDASFQILSIR